MKIEDVYHDNIVEIYPLKENIWQIGMSGKGEKMSDFWIQKCLYIGKIVKYDSVDDPSDDSEDPKSFSDPPNVKSIHFTPVCFEEDDGCLWNPSTGAAHLGFIMGYKRESELTLEIIKKELSYAIKNRLEEYKVRRKMKLIRENDGTLNLQVDPVSCCGVIVLLLGIAWVI